MSVLKKAAARLLLGLAPLSGLAAAESCRVELPGEDINIDFYGDDDFWDDLDDFFDDLDD